MVGALLAAMLMAAPPQDTPTAELSVTDLEEIVVEGRRLEEAARVFVDEIGEPPPGARPGRWNTPICLSVWGMQRRYAEYMIDRISVAALEAGAEVEGPGCRPNVFIMATDNGRQLAASLVEQFQIGFRPTNGGTNLGRRALENFRTSDAPVRWWHVTFPVDPESGDEAMARPGQDAPVTRVRDVSRLRSNVRYDIVWGLVIIDVSRVGDASLEALADYAALAALTQLNPDANLTHADSIANLFQPGNTVDSLTSWDRDYLKALYESRTDRATRHQQINDIVRGLVAERTNGEGETAPGPEE